MENLLLSNQCQDYIDEISSSEEESSEEESDFDFIIDDIDFDDMYADGYNF